MDKTLRELSNLYPDIKWEMAEPSRDVEENFGDGIILAGTKAGETKTFFILSKDKRKLQWGHVIANYLNGTVQEEKDV